jgi:hypothetical protein
MFLVSRRSSIFHPHSLKMLFSAVTGILDSLQASPVLLNFMYALFCQKETSITQATLYSRFIVSFPRAAQGLAPAGTIGDIPDLSSRGKGIDGAIVDSSERFKCVGIPPRGCTLDLSQVKSL